MQSGVTEEAVFLYNVTGSVQKNMIRKKPCFTDQKKVTVKAHIKMLDILYTICIYAIYNGIYNVEDTVI